MPFQMKEQPRQLDVRVPEPIDDRDPMLAKDRSCLRRGLIGDEQERSARAGLGRVHELPGCGGIGAPLGLNGDPDSPPGGTQDGVRPAVGARWPGDHDHSGDLS